MLGLCLQQWIKTIVTSQTMCVLVNPSSPSPHNVQALIKTTIKIIGELYATQSDSESVAFKNMFRELESQYAVPVHIVTYSNCTITDMLSLFSFY